MQLCPAKKLKKKTLSAYVSPILDEGAIFMMDTYLILGYFDAWPGMSRLLFFFVPKIYDVSMDLDILKMYHKRIRDQTVKKRMYEWWVKNWWGVAFIYFI